MPARIRRAGLNEWRRISGRSIEDRTPTVLPLFGSSVWHSANSQENQRADLTTKLAHAAAGVAFLTYLIGFAASFWLPEPGTKLAE